MIENISVVHFRKWCSSFFFFNHFFSRSLFVVALFWNGHYPKNKTKQKIGTDGVTRNWARWGYYFCQLPFRRFISKRPLETLTVVSYGHYSFLIFLNSIDGFALALLLFRPPICPQSTYYYYYHCCSIRSIGYLPSPQCMDWIAVLTIFIRRYIARCIFLRFFPLSSIVWLIVRYRCTMCTYIVCICI